MLLQHDLDGGPGKQSTPARTPSAASNALARCIGIDSETFADSYWGRKPLYTPARPDAGFDDLFSPAAVDELVSRRGLRTPFLRMAKEGTVLAEASFTRPGGSGATIADQVSDEKVLAQLAAGATLVLQALHRTWPPLVEFASALAEQLSHPVQVNSYITPAENRGFAAHYDTHDVFVLQIAGSKRWIIHEPVIEHPLADQPWDRRKVLVAAKAAEPPLLDQVLAPGDALYLPRGFLHAATAQGELSIHLTVGVHPVTGLRVLEALVERLKDDAEVRRSLPLGIDVQDPAAVAVQVRRITERLQTLIDDAEAATPAVVRTLDAHLHRNTRAAPLRPLDQLAAATGLTGDDVLQRRPGLRATVTATAAGTEVRALDKTVSFPPAMSKAVSLLLAGPPVSPAELPDLDAEEKLLVARRMLREGLVVPAAAAE